MNLKTLRSLFKVALAVVILMTNAAFKKGDSIQLGRNLNGRSTMNFTSSAKDTNNNISYLVKAGTIASVMDYRRLKSGNYGVQVRLEGPEYKDKPEAERTVWLYDWSNRNDDLKACADETCTEVARDMREAGWAQAVTDQTATAAPTEPLAQAKPQSQEQTANAAPGTSSEDTTGCFGWDCVTKTPSNSPQTQIGRLAEALPTPDRFEVEYEEEAPITAEDMEENTSGMRPAEGITFNGGALLPKACHDIIDNHGRIGPTGKLLLNTMFQSKYGSGDNNIFLKDNIMGGYPNGRPYGICPGFTKMNGPQKATALLVMWAALAFKEGSCSKVNDHMALQRAYGRWSAEKSAASRWKRGQACRGDITKDSVQVSCAVDTVAAFGKQGLMDGKTLMESGYFQPLIQWNKTSIYSRKHKKYLPFTPIKKYMQRIQQCA